MRSQNSTDYSSHRAVCDRERLRERGELSRCAARPRPTAIPTSINIPVPEHNPTGEPGGPFNSFDISWVDPVHHLVYVSDRIGLAMVVVDTIKNVAVNAIQGFNMRVAERGIQASPCDPRHPAYRRRIW